MPIFSRGYLFTEHSLRFMALRAFLNPQRYPSVNTNNFLYFKDKPVVVFFILLLSNIALSYKTSLSVTKERLDVLL